MVYESVLRLLLSSFVSHPEQIKILVDTECGIRVTLQVHNADHGFAMGTGAAMVKALRLVLRGMAQREGHKLWFNLIEPDYGKKETGKRFEPKEWSAMDEAHLCSIVRQVMEQAYGSQVENTWDEKRSLYRIIGKPLLMEEQSAWNTIMWSVARGCGRNAITLNFESA